MAGRRLRAAGYEYTLSINTKTKKIIFTYWRCVVEKYPSAYKNVIIMRERIIFQ